jgi:hypothetical protein
MTTTAYRTGSEYVATATALLLLLPQLGSPVPTSITPTTRAQYQALGDVGVAVAAAITPGAYAPVSLEGLSSLLWDAASRLLTQSKSLDPEFASIVNREFWNLLQ